VKSKRPLAVVRERYADFGPTLACEKLRTWMTAAGLWSTLAERRKRPQPPRARRDDGLGELVQIDGCEHDWFEGRGPRCTLLVYVDDATGQLMELRFARTESTFDYFAATERYLRRHGKPIAFYSDKASILRVNAKEAVGGVGYTQYGRAMRDLNIDVICANTPAAANRARSEEDHLCARAPRASRSRTCARSATKCARTSSSTSPKSAGNADDAARAPLVTSNRAHVEQLLGPPAPQLRKVALSKNRGGRADVITYFTAV